MYEYSLMGLDEVGDPRSARVRVVSDTLHL